MTANTASAIVRVLFFLALAALVLALAAPAWGRPAHDLFDPTLTPSWPTGSPAPLPTGTWVKHAWATETARAMPTPTLAATPTPAPLYSATPTELVYPPLLATPTPQVGEAAQHWPLWLPWVGR